MNTLVYMYNAGGMVGIKRKRVCMILYARYIYKNFGHLNVTSTGSPCGCCVQRWWMYMYSE